MFKSHSWGQVDSKYCSGLLNQLYLSGTSGSHSTMKFQMMKIINPLGFLFYTLPFWLCSPHPAGLFHPEFPLGWVDDHLHLDASASYALQSWPGHQTYTGNCLTLFCNWKVLHTHNNNNFNYLLISRKYHGLIHWSAYVNFVCWCVIFISDHSLIISPLC